MPALCVLAGIGIALSLYSLTHHFGTNEGWCEINETISCDIVNRGPYAAIGGIPVALIGVVGYASIVLSCVIAYLRPHTSRACGRFVRAAILIAFVFSCYLTSIEAFVLGAYCLVCLLSLAIVIGMMAVAYAPARVIKL